MPRESPRPFTLGDAMALVAATACGLALMRWTMTPLGPLKSGAGGSSIGANAWVHFFAFMHPSCFVVALMLALIPLRWRRPRPPASRVVRQPGAVACLAAAAAMVVGVAVVLAEHAIYAITYGPMISVHAVSYSNLTYWARGTDSIPLAVGGVWVALALGGRWSPERSWIDRLGRALGLYWVALWPFGFLSPLIDRWLPYSYSP